MTKKTAPEPAAATTTLSGFAVQVTGFIPIPKDDLRKQAEIPLLLLDIQEGKKTLADLMPHLRDLEFKQGHVNKRFEVSKAYEMLGNGDADPDDADPDFDEVIETEEETTGEA